MAETSDRGGPSATPVAPRSLDELIVVCNWNSRGLGLVRQLLSEEFSGSRRISIVSTDSDSLHEDARLLSELDVSRVAIIKGNPTRAVDLARAGVGEASSVIILAVVPSGPVPAGVMHPSDAQAIQVALAVDAANRHAPICAELAHERNRAHLMRAGAAEVVSVERMCARLLARCQMEAGVSFVLEHFLRNDSMSSEPYFIILPEWANGMTVGAFRATVHSERAILLGLRRHDGDELLNAGSARTLQSGDVLILLGESEGAVGEALESAGAAHGRGEARPPRISAGTADPRES